MQAIDDKAGSRLDELKNKLLAEFKIDQFLEQLRLALPDEYFALITNWHVPKIYLISGSEGFPYDGIYHPDEHVIVLRLESGDIIRTLAHELTHSGQALVTSAGSTVIEGVADLLAMRATGSMNLAYSVKFLQALVQDINSGGVTTINSFVTLDGEFNYEQDVNGIISTPQFKAILFKHLAGPRKSPCDAFLVFYMYFKQYLTLEETKTALKDWKDHPYIKETLDYISSNGGTPEERQLGEAFVSTFKPAPLNGSQGGQSENANSIDWDKAPEPPSAYQLINKNAALRGGGYLMALLGLLGALGWATRNVFRHRGK